MLHISTPESSSDARSPLWPAPVAVVLCAAVVGLFLLREPLPVLDALGIFGEQLGGPWRFPSDTVLGLLTLLAMWFAAVGLGNWTLDLLGAARQFPSLWQRYALGMLTGWLILGLAVLVLGLVGLCNRIALAALLAVAAGVGVRGWVKMMGPALRNATSEPRSEVRLPKAIWCAALLIYLIALPYALTPSVQSDELRYHLAAPEAYLEAGRIVYLPNQALSNYPFLIEMLYTMAMGLQGTEAARAIHFTFLEAGALLTALLCFALIRLQSFPLGARGLPRARAIAAAAGAGYAVIPTATIHACWAFVDVATVAYFLAVVYLGALALVRRRPPSAALLGLMVAGAIGTKYSMIPVTLGMGVLLTALLIARARARGRPIRAALVYISRASLVAALLGSPWFIKNLAWTGNPVYPLAHGIFGGGEWSEANSVAYDAKRGSWGYRLEGVDGPAARLAEFAISPVTSSLAWRRFQSNPLGPTPLIAMVLAVCGAGAVLNRRRGRRAPPGFRWAALWLLALLIGTWVFWFATYQTNRLLLGSLALVLAIGGWGAAELLAPVSSRDAPMRWNALVLGAVAAAGFLYSWSMTAVVMMADQRPTPFSTSLGFMARGQYLAQRLNYYESARWLGARLRPERRALLIGEHRTLYFPNEVVASDWFDTPQPLTLLEITEDNDQLLDALLADSVRYIYLNAEELRKYQAEFFRPRFTGAQWARFEALWTNPRLALVHKDERYDIFVYEVRPLEPPKPDSINPFQQRARR